VLLALLLPSAALGDVYIYANKGQSQQQQSKDRYECHSWAVHQTGLDPTRPPPAAASAAPPPWTVVISEGTGKLTASISDDGTGFVIFGACTAL